MKLLILTQKVDRDDDLLGFFETWIREIAAQAEEVKVIALAKGRYELPEKVEVVSLMKERGAPKFVRAILFYVHALRFLAQVDGVFVHMAPEYVKALYPLNFFFRRPIVMWYAHIKVSPTAKWAIDHVDFIFTPSKESFEYPSEKVISTGHGISSETFSPGEAPHLGDILSFSRISRVKRIETLVKALGILAREGRRLSASIYGEPARPEDGAYREELKALARHVGVAETISWKGSIPNQEAARIYRGHRIFVRMQGGGGFGKTELEAMACGVPAILPTPVYESDLPEFFPNLSFQEDDAHGLAERIKAVLEWPTEKRERYAREASAMVKNKHNIKNVAAKLVETLSTINK